MTERLITSGTAAGGSATTINLAASALGYDDVYAGMRCDLGDGRSRTISSYDGATKVATVPQWDATVLSLPGSSGNYAFTQDVAANSFAVDLDLKWRVNIPSAPVGDDFAIVVKWDSANNQRSFAWLVKPDGTLKLLTSPDGSTVYVHESTAAITFGGITHARVKFDGNDGSGNRVTTFETSSDGGANWSALGATVTRVGVTTIFDSNAAVIVGALPETADFELPLNDLGSGVVNTTVARGQATASFTRATSATCRGSDGTLLTVATGVPRSQYLSTLAYAGYLAESAGTNSCLQSENFSSASWTKTDTTATADQVTAPDGTLSGDLLTEGTAGTALVTQTITGTANATHSASRFIKFGNAQWIRLRLNNGGNSCDAWFDVQNGVLGTTSVAGTGAIAGASIEPWGNGWYRCKIMGSIGGGLTAVQFLSLSSTTNGGSTRVSNGTRYEWGAQFEDNTTVVSSYIKTTTTSATRNADVLSYAAAGSAFSSQGSVSADLSTRWTTAASAYLAVAIGDSTQGPLIESVSGASTAISANDGTNTVSKTGLTDMSTAVRKRAAAWGGSTMSITGDGAAVGSGSFDGAFTADAIYIGCRAAGANAWNGTIKNVRLWTKKLSDAGLQAVTAGNALPPADVGPTVCNLAGDVYKVEIGGTINGAAAAVLDVPTDGMAGDTTVTSSATGEVWTISQSSGTSAELEGSPDTSTGYEIYGDPDVTVETLRAVFCTLNADSDVTTLLADHAYLSGDKAIYDDVPQSRTPESAAEFPYVVVGDLTQIPFDADDFNGREMTLTIHTFSRYRGAREANSVMDAIKEALHDQTLGIAGETPVLTLWEYAEILRDPDGLTRHGVQRFRIITQGS